MAVEYVCLEQSDETLECCVCGAGELFRRGGNICVCLCEECSKALEKIGENSPGLGPILLVCFAKYVRAVATGEEATIKRFVDEMMSRWKKLEAEIIHEEQQEAMND